ncbi:MAG: FAD-dependent oxidoreductase [Acidimicrobiia bacterium]|nr:FAD-dependent oxidoreductase [Acidimicrobiia bacterium]
MGKPAIIAIDDDPQVLSAVARDLRSRYGEEFRIVRAPSGGEALQALTELQRRGDTVAAFVADQRMPVMTGTQFLASAREVFPRAKKVLLTAYADTDAAIDAINAVGLDHYLMKPWDPPEENLYPVLDDLLDDWRANVPPPFDGIRVVGVRWSPISHDVRDFLARNQVPYRFVDVERDDAAAAMVDAATAGTGTVPIVFFPDGSNLVQPSHVELAEKVGLQTEARNPFYDLIIVGAGPAGLGAGVYGASEGLRTAIIEREATGGQAGTSSRIENYLGFPQGISGKDLARRATTQARKFGAEILTAVEVTNVRVDDSTRVVELSDGTELGCHALVVATGMTIRKLAVPDHDRFVGAGIYYGAAPSEAVEYRGGHVFVVGAANSAGQASMMLSKYVGNVTILVRGDSLEAKMSQYLVDQIRATPNIDVRTGTQIAEVHGADRLEAIVLRDRDTGELETVESNGMFIFIGARPHSDFLEGIVGLDARGFVRTGSDVLAAEDLPTPWPLDRDPYLMETSVPGIFAAGDVRAGVVRRVASAVGQGAVCVSMIHGYLDTV